MLVAQQLLVETTEVDAQIVFLGERSRRPAESRELFGGRMAFGLGETCTAHERAGVVGFSPSLGLGCDLLDAQPLQVRRQLLMIPGGRRV